MASIDTNKPNILFILTDDQGIWAMGCAGNPEIRTPNLDRLAATGMRFNNCFCVSPVCSPARASILTGRIPSQHGVHDWLCGGNYKQDAVTEGRLIEYLKGQPGYTDVLSQHGYVCGLSGKWHLGDSHHPQKGFSYWAVHAKGGGPYYGAPMIRDDEIYHEPRYVTDVITDNGIAFLDRQADGDQPFYLGVHYTAPHSPWDREQHPSEIYDEYFENCAFTSVPDEPIHPQQINSAPVGWTPAERRAILSGYYAAVTAMDHNVGRLLDRLEALGLRENTLVIFTSDNGMNMGHHGVYGKGNGTFPLNMFDTSVKVPCLISRPGHVPGGTVADGLVSHYDIMPTLLEYTGIDNPESDRLPGSSFAAVLSGKSRNKERDPVVVYDEYGPVRMIRTSDWKYVHRYPYGPHELYDLAHDPGETINRVSDPECASRLIEMRAGLDAWFARYVDPMLDGSREPVYGKGQYGLAGPAGCGKKAFHGDWYYIQKPDIK